MKKLFSFLFFIVLFISCEKKDVEITKNIRLKSYRTVYSESNKVDVYRGTYVYDKNNNLIAENQNDTTYLLKDKQIIPVKTTITYEYDDNDFLIKSTRQALSIILTATAVTLYDYRNGLLSTEDLGNRVREYRYDANGKLTTTIFNSLSTGVKTVTEYDDQIPKALVKTNEGYSLSNNNEITYLDNDLLVKRYEKYSNGQLIFEQDYTQRKSGLPQLLLPNFKGFPKIKAFDYQKGIENEIVTYQFLNGKRVLSDKKTLKSTFDERDNLIKNEGTEEVNLETTNPMSRTLLFEYTYEAY
jgi:YD repeat-containing protein